MSFAYETCASAPVRVCKRGTWPSPARELSTEVTFMLRPQSGEVSTAPGMVCERRGCFRFGGGGLVHVKALKMEGVETFEGKDAAVAKGD